MPDIIYFRAEQKYVVIRHINGESLIDESLKALLDEFGDEFLHIHRKYVVAKAYIAGLEIGADGRHEITLRGLDERLPVSRRHAANVKQALKSLGAPR